MHRPTEISHRLVLMCRMGISAVKEEESYVTKSLLYVCAGYYTLNYVVQLQIICDVNSPSAQFHYVL